MKRKILILSSVFISFNLSFHSTNNATVLIVKDSLSNNLHFNQIEGNECLDCHNDLITNEKVHFPASESCIECHQSTSKEHPSEEKGFTLSEKVPGLCYICHDQKNTKKNIHYPISEGECMLCHSPHSSTGIALLKYSPSAKLCEECHDSQIPENERIHVPVAEGNCENCHDVHHSDYSNLLKSEKSELCIKCHENEKELLSLKNAHPPFMDDCSVCHKTHSSKEKYLLTEKTPDLCYYCHEDPGNKSNVHQPVRKGECTKCHSPHASNERKYLIYKGNDICFGCHNRTILSEDQTISYSNIKKLLDNSEYIHAPLEIEGCSVCHNPHSSENQSLLTQKFPVGLYAVADAKNFALCFECHDSALLTSGLTSNITGFRNGQENLHYLHIKGSKGRNCINCHNIHGSMNQHLIKETTLFGNWETPIKYNKLENGGSCAPGCHTEFVYIR
ncbi:cytochrome c3 family protein [Bacteroidota bacterium]